MMKKGLLGIFVMAVIAIVVGIAINIGMVNEANRIADYNDFRQTYETAWKQVEEDFPEARGVIYYNCLDDYYVDENNSYFVVVRKFNVYYDTMHVDNYNYKLVMHDSDIIMSEYWEV